jgi:hypothetical protein
MRLTWRGTVFNSIQQSVSSSTYSYVYYTQIMQAETLAAAYRTWRRNWAGPGREYTAGVLVWQVGALRGLVVPTFSSLISQ